MLPSQCDHVMLVAWGAITSTEEDEYDWAWKVLKEFYHGIKLVLKQYKELSKKESLHEIDIFLPLGTSCVVNHYVL
eukprot:11967985-Ditylum_brightwellii.AAC.1